MNVDSVRVRPLKDRLIVKRLDAQTQTKGGLWIPDVAKEKPAEGEVLAVGEGFVHDEGVRPLDVKPGDKVLFGKYSGTEVKIDGEERVILREADIIGILR